MVQRLKTFICIAVLMGSSFGCSVHQITGDTMTGYTRQHLIPYLMEHGTLDSACGLGLSMGGFVNSFERVTASPHHAAIPTLISAASCFEEQAWQAELRYLRAVGRAQVSEATDARIAEQIAHRKAAEALYNAYLRTMTLFPSEPGQCPVLETDEDELVWLLGNIGGVQAVQHDGAAGRLVEVPLDVPVKAMRAMSCLDNQKWWGMPQATQAAVWIIVPGSSEGTKDAAGNQIDPFSVLNASLKVAEASEIRSAFAIAAMVFENAGQTKALQDIITRYAKLTEDSKTHEKQLLELVARRQLIAASDRIWTNQSGHRTPLNQFGAFPSLKGSDTAPDNDDLLDDL
jgi:hypothetical protein